MSRFDVILFDLGGTLTYFDGNWADVINRAEQALFASLLADGLQLKSSFIDAYHKRLLYYYRERDSDLVEHSTLFILRQLLTEWGYPHLDDVVYHQALADFRDVTQRHWFLAEDAKATLENLVASGYRLGLVSNAADDTDVQSQIDEAQIRRHFEVILTSAAEGIRKPDPKIFQSALDRLDILPERAVMVGDTLRADILGGKNAGLFTIWITKWADTPLNRADAHTISADEKVKTLSDLPSLLQSLEENYGKSEMG